MGEVAARYGVTRQSVTAWRKRYEHDGLDGLKERSRRPHHSPARVAPDIEAEICELRRTHRRWGARRISFELGRRGVEPAPAQATVHRILVRNGFVRGQAQRHKRKYKRWQREAPMQLWQMDLVSGVFLADGRECKLITGIDDHSRFVVIAHVVVVPTGRAVCEAFVAAMRRYGVPSEVLTDNGKQFTGRFTRPFPAEVLFERICRQNGITARLTKRRSPTTTGKIERFHATLRTELLDEVKTFASLDAAQDAITSWVHTYNHSRPHQSLGMATPTTRFRPSPTQDLTVPAAAWQPESAVEPGLDAEPESAIAGLPEPRPEPPTAVEWEAVVPPSGLISIVQAQQLWMGPAYSGRIVSIWADTRSIHVCLDGHYVKTVRSRLNDEHLRQLRMRGAKPAGPPPAAPALPSTNGRRLLPDNLAIEVDRILDRNAVFRIRNEPFTIDRTVAGQRVTLRLDGHVMHAIVNDALVKSWPYPITLEQRLKLTGARQASTPLPPAPPGEAQYAERRVRRDGRIMVARQKITVGTAHTGKIVTILVEDTHYRILDGDHEIGLFPRRADRALKHFKAQASAKPQGAGNDVPRTDG